MEAKAQLSALAPEVLEIIIESAHASCHWPLAQTCKYIYSVSQPILDRHRVAHQKFRITSDLHPLTVINLLWGVFSDDAASIEAWHVREFEVWGSRTQFADKWEHWVPWIVDAETGKVSDGDENIPWTLEDDDIDFFRDKITTKLPQFIGDDGHYYDTAFLEFTTGEDGFLKGLLLACLPRLNALRFAQNDSDRHSSLEWLSLFTCWCRMTGYWLPGLETLTKVAVGVSLRRSDMYPSEATYVAAEDLPDRRLFDLYGLLCLPNISEVYFSHIEQDFSFEQFEDILGEGNFQPTEKSSALKTMILDNPGRVIDDRLVGFLCKIPMSLNTFVIRSDSEGTPFFQDDIRRLPSILAEHQSPSLQRFLLYAVHDRNGRTGLVGYGPEKLKGFEDLRLVNVLLDDVETTLDPIGKVQARSELLNRLIRVFEEDFPKNIEVLDLRQNDDCSFQTENNGDDAELDYLDDAVTAMINSNRYEHLKTIFLDNVQVRNLKKRRKNVHFPKAIKAGEERGVHVQTQGRKQSESSLETQFVVMPDRYDMLTGPFVKRDESWVLDRLDGSLTRPRREELGQIEF